MYIVLLLQKPAVLYKIYKPTRYKLKYAVLYSTSSACVLNLPKSFTSCQCLASREIIQLPPPRGLNLLNVRNLKKCMELNWNFQSGAGL